MINYRKMISLPISQTQAEHYHIMRTCPVIYYILYYFIITHLSAPISCVVLSWSFPTAFTLLGLRKAVCIWSNMKAPPPNPATMNPLANPLWLGNHYKNVKIVLKYVTISKVRIASQIYILLFTELRGFIIIGE